MSILIVYKESNYEIHGERVEAYAQSGQISQDVLDALKEAHHAHYDALAKLKEGLAQKKLAYVDTPRSLMRDSEITQPTIITVGGDGTLLFTAQMIKHNNCQVIGLRSTNESVGYLCAYNHLNIEQLISDIVSEQVPLIEAERIEAQIKFADGRKSVLSPPVLNDFLFANTNPAHTCRYRVALGAESALHRSSGIWISSAVGSSAAINSAGGVIQPHGSHNFQFRVRELYLSSPSVRILEGALFNPEATPLNIRSYCENAILALDGQHQLYEISYGDSIEFGRASKLKLAHQPSL
jgi:NAD+ kinase